MVSPSGIAVIRQKRGKELKSFSKWHIDNTLYLCSVKVEGIQFGPKRKLKPHMNFKLIVMGMQKSHKLMFIYHVNYVNVTLICQLHNVTRCVHPDWHIICIYANGHDINIITLT